MSEYWHTVTLGLAYLVLIGSVFGFSGGIAVAFESGSRWGWAATVLAPVAAVLAAAYLITFGGAA